MWAHKYFPIKRLIFQEVILFFSRALAKDSDEIIDLIFYLNISHFTWWNCLNLTETAFSWLIQCLFGILWGFLLSDGIFFEFWIFEFKN
jgi:hypothetical protein